MADDIEETPVATEEAPAQEAQAPPVDRHKLHHALINQLTSDSFLQQHPRLPHPTKAEARSFNGDEGLGEIPGDIGDAYEKAMRSAGETDENIKWARPKLEEMVKRRSKELALQSLANTQPRYASEWEQDPFFGDIRAKNHQRHVENGWNAIRGDQGDMNDYLQVASELNRQTEDAQRGTAGKVARGFLGAGKMISQYGMLSQVAGGLGAGGTGVSGALRTGLGYTAARLPFTGAQDLLAGKPLGEVAKDEAYQYFDNTLFAGVAGVGGGKAMPPSMVAKAKETAWGALKLLAASEISEDAKAAIEGNQPAGPLTRFAQAVLTGDKAKTSQAFVNLMEEQGPLQLLNAAFHVIQSGGRADPKALVEKLSAQELLKQQMQQKGVMPPGPERPAAQSSVRPEDISEPTKEVMPNEGQPQPRSAAEPAGDIAAPEQTAPAPAVTPPEITHHEPGGPEPGVEREIAERTPQEKLQSLTTDHQQAVKDYYDAQNKYQRAQRSTFEPGGQKRLKDARSAFKDAKDAMRGLEKQLDQARTAAYAEPAAAPIAPGPPISPEGGPEPTQKAPVERRTNLELREMYERMPEEERQRKLFTSDVTGLPNKRAFEANEKEGKAQAIGYSDADGLKALNDKFGYDAGNAMLRAKADVLRHVGLDAYHEKGDEFMFRGGSPQEIHAKLERARELLRDHTIEVQMADGSVRRFQGADFSHGVGNDLSSAESALKAHKAQREAAGERARGELRGIKELGPQAGPGVPGGTAGERPPETTAPRSALERMRRHQQEYIGPQRTRGQAVSEPRAAKVMPAEERDTAHHGDEKWDFDEEVRKKIVEEKKARGELTKEEAAQKLKEKGPIALPSTPESEAQIARIKAEIERELQDEHRLLAQEQREDVESTANGYGKRGLGTAPIRSALAARIQQGLADGQNSAQAQEAATRASGQAAGVPEVPEPAGGTALRPETAAAGGGPAGSNVVNPATQARLNAYVKGGERVLVVDLKEALKEHHSPEEIKAALKIAGDFPKGVEGHVKLSTLRGTPRQMEGGQRKWAGEQQLLKEVIDHETAKAGGLSAGAAQEALHSGEAAGVSQAHETVGKEPLRDIEEPGGIGARAGEPGAEPGREPWDLITGESGAVNLDRLRKFFFGGGEEEPNPTGIKNVAAAREREKAGLPPVLEPTSVGHTYPELRDQVEKIARDEPGKIDSLVKELKKKQRPITDLEDAMLLHRQNDLRNEYGRALTDKVTAGRGGDAISLNAAETHESGVRDSLREITDITKEAGTATARGLAARRMMVNADFSLAHMMLEAEAAKGRRLTPEEERQLVASSQRIAELEGRLTAAAAHVSAAAPEAGDISKVNQTLEQAGRSPLTPEDIAKSHQALAQERFPAMQKAWYEAEQAKNQFRRQVEGDRMSQRPLGEKVADLLVKLRRAFVISSPKTMAKIMAASTARMTITPMEEGVGAILSRLPGLSKIASMAPREGRGFSPGTEKQALIDGLTKGFSDAWQTVKTGGSELDTLYGKEGGTPRSWLDFVGELHAAGKAPAVRNEYTRSFLQRIDSETAAGKDVTSPAALMRISVEAYKDSQRAKFQQDNRVVDAWKRGVATLSAKDASLGAKTIGFAAKMLVPVVRIPTNLVAEAMQYATGSVTGSVRAGVALAKGVESLKPAEADHIMRSLKKGSLGLAALALGYFNQDIMGGFYSGKRKKEDVEPGAIRTPAGDVPSWALHNPLAEILNMGSAVRRAKDETIKGVHGDMATGVGAGILGLAEEVPFFRETAEIAKGLSHRPNERGRFFGELAKSLAVPQLFQWLAGRMDTDTGNPVTGETVKRKPQGVLQHVEMGIPGLRQNVGPQQVSGRR